MRILQFLLHIICELRNNELRITIRKYKHGLASCISVIFLVTH